ncbi:MAG: TIGR02099 family protein [Rhodocyclaceae bacterium]|nr:TIGR02099 family protein [Rhodocyclaceae bacterium]
MAGIHALAIVLTIIYFLFALLILVLRLGVLPQIENYRSDIEQSLGEALHRDVKIRHIDAYWVGLHPALTLHGLEIKDVKGRAALQLDTVEAELAWDSLLTMQMRLARLEILGPSLVVRRDVNGKISIAGVGVDDAAAQVTEEQTHELVLTTRRQVDASPEGDAASDWLLAQHKIVIRDASITWIDESRQAPPLELKQLNFSLENDGSRHRLGLTAQPPLALASRIDLRADFRGEELSTIATWKGETYLELDYADLAIWQKWINYPVELPQGKGALRLWLSIDKARVESATADVRIDNLRVRLRKDLAELELAHLEGRLGGRHTNTGTSITVKKLQLATTDGINIAPTDVSFSWVAGQGKKPATGSMSANGLDLDALARLAGHLPIDDAVRTQLAAYAPGGLLHDLALEWTGEAKDLQRWKIAGRFEKLRLNAHGEVPGLDGISGSISGNERGGQLTLAGQQAALNLPQVFPQPRIELTAFAAQTSWKASDAHQRDLAITLDKLSFANQDVSGEGSGRWHATNDAAGEVDLTVKLSRAKADSVWRYLPLSVGDDTRKWLQQSLSGGTVSDVMMHLKGKLADYPYRGGKTGTFIVKGKFVGGNLDYAPGWPAIEKLSGELLFEGEKMRIRATSGQVFGANLKDVTAELPDLEALEQILTIKGKAAGPTSEFLHFIDDSPVAESIDKATEDMRAVGNGELDLKLVIPLSTEAPARVEGSYRFFGNRLIVDDDVPPLTDLNGLLKFTSNSLESKGLRANLLGTPMNAEIKSGSDGNVQVNANGEISVAGLRAQYPLPLFDHLSGAAKWTGNIRVKRKVPELVITSNLVGLSSSLPVPFNKSALEAIPVRFERKVPPPADLRAARAISAKPRPTPEAASSLTDTLELTVGKIAQLQLLRRLDPTSSTITRGLLNVAAGGLPAQPIKLPERGIQVAVNVPRVDLDFWRPMFATPNSPQKAASPEAVNTPALPLQFDVHAEELQVFGKRFGNLRLSGTRADSLTRFAIKTTEVSGNFDWDSRGNGKLSGKIPVFTLPEAAVTNRNTSPITASDLGANDASSQIPALDVTIGKLLLKDKALGSLALIAENTNGEWRGKFDVHNDDATLKGTALWRPSALSSTPVVAMSVAPVNTSLEFDVDAKNLEKLLDRFGYGETLRKGSAKINGQLSWQGSPLAFDYPTLSGKFKVDLDDGQFRQLEPGVGRLLGILSLQSLPRRITLDFRDIFSQGFAFDSIEGDVVVSRGVMDTSNLEINGPSARVLLSGSINLANETQNLKVKVQPAVGDSLAVGAMLVNPIAGAALWLSQKLLKDPVGQVLSFEYSVSGSWTDPKVVKFDKDAGQTKAEVKARP